MRTILSVAFFVCLFAMSAAFGMAVTALLMGSIADAITAVLFGWVATIACGLCVGIARSKGRTQ